MLHKFLTLHTAELIDRCQFKAGLRVPPLTAAAASQHGVPQFLAQLIRTLEVETTAEPELSRTISGADGGQRATSEIGTTAARHGLELLHQGLTIDQVVHDYGDLCQAIMDLASDRWQTIEIDEYRTLNRCLDNGIADAVREFSSRRDALLAEKEMRVSNEKLGYLAHELRNQLNTAMLAVAAIKTGNVGLTGATGAVLERSLIGLRTLIDRSLADVRVTANMPARLQPVAVADFMAEITVSASLDAHARHCAFTVAAVDPALWINIDREMLLAAVGNLLQNAFKFTVPGTAVALSAYASGDRLLIDVEDHCGGLPSGQQEKMFQPFSQIGVDKSGMGLGLLICRRSVEVNQGVVRVRDLPGVGCRFTIDLPLHK